jgi:hypothetical protein
MTDKFFKRLTPTIPGQPGVFHIESQARIVTGFVTGGRTEGAGFPQWAKPMFAHSKATHYFELATEGFVVSKCGRVYVAAENTLLPGNFQRCRDCERRYIKALRK